MDVLDHNSQICGYGSKLCFDFTRKVEFETQGEDIDIIVPEKITNIGVFVNVNTELAKNGWSIILLGADRESLNLELEVSKFIKDNDIKGVKLFIIMDKEHDLNDYPTIVWVAGNNIDPIRDSVIGKEHIIFDARSKFTGLNGFNRAWPNVVLQSENIIKSVDKKWEHLGLGEFIESPTRRYEKLRFSESASADKI